MTGVLLDYSDPQLLQQQLGCSYLLAALTMVAKLTPASPGIKKLQRELIAIPVVSFWCCTEQLHQPLSFEVFK